MKNKKDFSSKILDVIKEGKIKPKPRWEFLLKDYAILATGILSIIIGGLAVAVIIFMVVNSNWDLLPYFNRTRAGHFFVSLPYYWLLSLSLFILIAYYNLKHTKKGYRYTLHSVVLISIGTSMILGVFFYSVGVGRTIDNTFSRRLPIYKDVAHRIPKEFISPGNGILAGKILDIEENFILVKAEREDREWFVDVSNLRQKCVPEYDEEDRVIIMGEINEGNTFIAFGIRPWDKEEMFKQVKKCGHLFREDIENIKRIINKSGIYPGMDPRMIQKEIIEGMKENY